jgi:hypothetical protein
MCKSRRPGLVTADGRPVVNEEKHLREALVHQGEFDPVSLDRSAETEYDNYYAKIRAEVGYADEAFESDAESGREGM